MSEKEEVQPWFLTEMLPPPAPDTRIVTGRVSDTTAGTIFLKLFGWTDEEIAAIDDEGDDE